MKIKNKKKLPTDLKFRAVTFMDGENGYHEQHFRNEEFNITVISIKENRDTPWKRTFHVDSLPDKVFNSLKELENAL